MEAVSNTETGKINLAALRNAIKQEEDRVNKVIEAKQKDIFEHKALVKRLDDLPKKLRHDIMVPFGSVGFMPGKIVRTNEVYQLVGSGYFVERSCFQANECLKRRLSVLRDIIEDCNKEKKLMTDQLSYAEQLFSGQGNQKNEVDIMEPYDEEKEAEFRKKRIENAKKATATVPSTSNSDQDIYMERLAELEKQEKDNKELEETEEVDEDDNIKPPPGVSKEEYKQFLQSLEDDDTSDEEMTSGDDEEDQEDEYSISGNSPVPSPQKSTKKQERLDSDDTDNDEDNVPIKEAKSTDKRKRSVTFASNIEISHTIKSDEPVTAVKIAKEHVSGRRDSILRNKDAKIELNEEALAAEKLNEDRPKVVPSSQTAFTGLFVERQITDIVENKTENSTKPVSKFKRQRAKEKFPERFYASNRIQPEAAPKAQSAELDALKEQFDSQVLLARNIKNELIDNKAEVEKLRGEKTQLLIERDELKAKNSDFKTNLASCTLKNEQNLADKSKANDALKEKETRIESLQKDANEVSSLRSLLAAQEKISDQLNQTILALKDELDVLKLAKLNAPANDKAANLTENKTTTSPVEEAKTEKATSSKPIDAPKVQDNGELPPKNKEEPKVQTLGKEEDEKENEETLEDQQKKEGNAQVEAPKNNALVKDEDVDKDVDPAEEAPKGKAESYDDKPEV